MILPPIVQTTLAIIALAVKYEPQAEEVYKNAKILFQMWFSAGLIDAATQNALNDWADAHQAATLAGEIPPELTVE